MEGSSPDCAPQVEPILAGGGEMGARMREIDWSRTPLGPVETWPQSAELVVVVATVTQYQRRALEP